MEAQTHFTEIRCRRFDEALTLSIMQIANYRQVVKYTPALTKLKSTGNKRFHEHQKTILSQIKSVAFQMR